MVPRCCGYLHCDIRPWLDRHGFAARDREDGGMAEIRAEIVATVLNVRVHEGDTIDDGDTVVLVESMKMEIPVLTETAGVVTRLAVHEGDLVQEGDLIAVVE
jgi:biotin carboxyl carrier protein